MVYERTISNLFIFTSLDPCTKNTQHKQTMTLMEYQMRFFDVMCKGILLDVDFVLPYQMNWNTGFTGMLKVVEIPR